MYKRILLATVKAVIATGVLFYAHSNITSSSGRQDVMLTHRSPSVRQQVEQGRLIHGGMIEGRVINSEGQPVAGAKMCAERDDALSGRRLCSHSDDNGEFKVEVLEGGTYSVFGSKEDDGYASTISGFHREDGITVPKVFVVPGQTVRNVAVQLGSRAGMIEGTITDATDHKPISKVTLTLRRADNPDIYYMIGAMERKENGRFKVLVPATPFTLEVSSLEYETWTYDRNGLNNHSDPITVRRGENKNLTIALKRKKQPQ